TVMLVSMPFGYIAGLLSDVSRVLPFVLNIGLLIIGIVVTTLFYRQTSNKYPLQANEECG
ncbi:MAG TPA: MFS transporter, partial [Thermoclostridium sp.]|nr:MFS transporter [Thermoclostridium sp.]